MATSVTAFVGRALRGPVEEPVAVASCEDFARAFGGIWPESPLGPAVADFFRQGGAIAVVVRAHTPAAGDTALLTIDDVVALRAMSPGTWGSKLVARTDDEGRLLVSDTATGETEVLPGISRLIRADALPEQLPPARTATLTPATSDGEPLDLPAYRRALEALGQAHLVNLLVVPGEPSAEVAAEAVAFAEERRAVALLGPPAGWSTVEDAVAGAASSTFPRSPNAAVYFPRILEPGPVRDPAGAVAGIMARTDATRGVWTSPAGLEADLRGVATLDLAVPEPDAARLNAQGVNCLRAFPGTGPVVWGARTTDLEWKYVAVRRLVLFLEHSIERGLGWAVFEPNDEALWARIRAEVSAFLDDLFGRGAFAGTSPRHAYRVRCDRETTSQDDLDAGRLDVVVGVAPLRPAEFVTLRIRICAGRTA